MIPPRDRVGQIRSYREYLQQRLGATVRGAWIAERVWEQSMTADLVEAGVDYIMLDDSHLKSAGLKEDDLWGYYLTEAEGRLLRVFPGSEPLRYQIPFASPEAGIETLRQVAERGQGAVAVFADDGEKFGSWPDTKKPIYEEGWLRRFFDLVTANADWIQVSTPSETIDQTPPLGKVYIPEGSYREMTEWVLPTDQLQKLIDARTELKDQPQWKNLSRFVHGGVWRNFLVKYPEVNEMYTRMMAISGRLDQLAAIAAPTRFVATNGYAGQSRESLLTKARRELYRGTVQLPVLAWGVRRSLSAAFTQRDLSAFDYGRRAVGSNCWPA